MSGGQKQRLAIARAILRRPKVLIFDEATSALDQETAERFAETVNKLKGAATILFVAHQVPRALGVDEVVRVGSVWKMGVRVLFPRVEGREGRIAPAGTRMTEVTCKRG